MFISKIEIENYRNFDSTSVRFKDGINLIIGENNSGKSNLIKSLAMIFDQTAKRQLSVDDFNNNISLEELKKGPPKISISVQLSQSKEEKLMSDELVTVSNWLIALKEPYKACITYEYFLPESEKERYLNAVKEIDNQNDVWETISRSFIRFYTYKIWVGNVKNQVTVDSESLKKFDFQYLDAIRDVERDMLSGRSTLLKNVIDFFIDYEIKSNEDLSEEEKKSNIKKKEQEFEDLSTNIIEILKTRLERGNKEILSYSSDIGASFDNTAPGFEGNINESELYAVLKLIVKQDKGRSIPISNNGLGYNNLIYMSLLLAKMQVDSDGQYLGSNAKVFPILAIEEPEAHLHPTMQFHFIKFLKKNIKEKKVKQIFITSHSTHFTSTIHLDNITCLYKKCGKTKVSYPGEVFYECNKGFKVVSDTKEQSKKYVQRFLDATKSNMLFAEKIIFVEGIAEQLLLPVFAEYLGKSLEENHIAVINIGGRNFGHFLNLFDTNKKEAIDRKIACITDLDPTRKEKKIHNSKYKKCYPYEYNRDINKFEYKVNESVKDYSTDKHPNIHIFTQEEKFGKTFEFQLAFENETNNLLLTPSIDNRAELEAIINIIIDNKPMGEIFKELRESDENQRIVESLENADKETWTNELLKKAAFASRYLNSVGKGENALELSVALKENLTKKGTDEHMEFKVPDYIKQAIMCMCD